MVRAHNYGRRAPRSRRSPSRAASGVSSAGRDGGIVLRHQTSERVLATLPSAGPVSAALITPKADGLLTLEGDALERYALHNPHPEISWKTLFGKVWYEGYARAEYVWQSTGATDDIEPSSACAAGVRHDQGNVLRDALRRASGGACRALHVAIRRRQLPAMIKPTVEIMAALPSVVIGFLAGLYLAVWSSEISSPSS